MEKVKELVEQGVITIDEIIEYLNSIDGYEVIDHWNE